MQRYELLTFTYFFSLIKIIFFFFFDMLKLYSNIVILIFLKFDFKIVVFV